MGDEVGTRYHTFFLMSIDMYVQYTHVLCYNIEEYGICIFCNR